MIFHPSHKLPDLPSQKERTQPQRNMPPNLMCQEQVDQSLNQCCVKMNQLVKRKRIWNLWISLCLFALFDFSRTALPRPFDFLGDSLAYAEETATAAYGRKIHEIEVGGLKRIEKDAVLNKIQSKVGTILTEGRVREDIDSLYKLGHFREIEFKAETKDTGIKLFIQVKELPAISDLQFEGNEKIKAEELKDVVKLKQWAIMDINQARQDVAAIQKAYEEKGYFLSRVTYEVTPVNDSEVKLTFKITDFEKVQIQRISFLNNKKFSDNQLKNALGETREGGFFSFASGSGNFKESAFKVDLQRLSYFYLDQGYVKFKYDTPSITVSEDKRSLFVSLHVEEGEQYKMGRVSFSGDLLYSTDELEKDLVLREDQTFRISQHQADIQKLTEMYQDLGYAFVNVIPKLEFNDEEKRVDVEFSFEKGELTYFGNIKIVGNSKTHDKTIRRELRVQEGELFHGSRLRSSKENVERLGFFQPGDIVFNQITSKEKPNVVDLEISIKERPTGTVTVGAGFSSNNGFFFQSQISEQNFQGKGQNISFQAQFSKDRNQRNLTLGFTDPYSFETKWTTGGDLFYTLFNFPTRYDLRKTGFDVRAGYPLSDYTSVFLTYKFERMKIISFDIPNALYGEFQGGDQGLLSSYVTSIVRDRRNNRLEPSGGSYQSLSVETAGLTGGDKKFVKIDFNNRYFKRLFGDLVFRSSLELGQIYRMGTLQAPPAERYALGGPNSLKGFNALTISPTRLVPTGVPGFFNQQALGGYYQALGITELEYPLIPEAGIKMVTFFDAGNAFSHFPSGKKEPFTLRADWGFGIRWFSPIGPLRFEFAYPLKTKGSEESSQFLVFIGPPF